MPGTIKYLRKKFHTVASGVKVNVPSAPTMGTATAGNAQATITYTNSASDGGYAISQYVVQVYPNNSWRGIATSSTGTKLIASNQGGYLYTSTDSGNSWTQRRGIGNWLSVASSSDGVKLVACDTGGYLWTSTDSGVTWTQRADVREWFSLASSANGTILYAAVYQGVLWKSVDSGVTWNMAGASGSSFWQSICCSADGTKVLASGYVNNPVVSTNSGNSWVHKTPAATGSFYCAMSADGSKMYVCDDDYNGYIWTSTDFGNTWTSRINHANFQGIACSADGSKVFAIASGSYKIWVSGDYGVTWSQQGIAKNWKAVTCSADGMTVIAVVQNGLIYISNDAGVTWRSIIQSIPNTGSGGVVTATSLTNGTAYQFSVVAKNALGYSIESALSNSVTPVVPVTLPSAPLSVSAVAGNGQATVSFTAPASNGGATIDSYIVSSYPSGGQQTGASSPITKTGLTNGVAYQFTVMAHNSAGYGPESYPLSVAVTPYIPDYIADGVSFSWVTGAAITTYYYSNTVTISGLSAGLQATISLAGGANGTGGFSQVNVNGTGWVSANLPGVLVSNGNTLQIRIYTGSTHGWTSRLALNSGDGVAIASPFGEYRVTTV